MAKKNNILGIDKFELGAPGDGVMGDDLTNFPDIEVSSVTLDGGTVTQTNIATEGEDVYLSVNDAADPSTVTARLYGVTAEQMVTLAGGEVGADGLWEKPAQTPDIHLSMNLEGKEVDGQRSVIRFPYAKIQARPQGTVTKNALPAIEVTLTANVPVSEAGVKGSPVHYGTLVAEV